MIKLLWGPHQAPNRALKQFFSMRNAHRAARRLRSQPASARLPERRVVGE
ncbi:hypothetical protein ACFQS6_22855 [Xanthomonas populi]